MMELSGVFFGDKVVKVIFVSVLFKL